MRTTIFKIIEAVSARERKEYATSKLQHEPERGNGKKRGQSFGHKTGKTVREFLEAVDQKLIAEVKEAKGKIGAGFKGLKLQREVRDPAAVVAFDKSYKRYIYNILIRKFGFTPSKYKTDENGNPKTGYKRVYGKEKLDLECVYHDVLSRLLLGAMDGFDMNQPRIGKGAFRNYLKKVITSVYSDVTAPDLVPVYNNDGTKQYTTEVVKDKNGKPKLDAKGNKVYKQKMIPLESIEADNIRNAMAEHGNYDCRQGFEQHSDWTSDDISKVRAFFMKISYLKFIDKKMKSKGSEERWILNAMLDIFERGKDEGDVMTALLKNATINKRGSFDVAKARFLNDWAEMAKSYQAKILKQVRIDNKSARGDVNKARPTRKGVYVWRPIVSRNKAEKIMLELLRETKSEVGAERLKFVNANFERMMLGLVQVADKKAAAKKAKRYEPEENE